MIDVIIPFYRTPKKYFLNCLKSLQNQTIHNQLNIILINDDVDRNCIDLCLSEPEFDIIKTFRSFNVICNNSKLVLQDCPWNKKEIFGKFLF